MLKRLLRRVGIVSAGQYAVISRQLRKAEDKIAKQAGAVEEARTEARTWKARAAEAEKASQAAVTEADAQSARAHAAEKALHAASKEAESDRARRAAQFDTVKSQLEEQVRELRADLERSQSHTPRATVDVDALQRRLADVERELAISREYLMALEVKLDVLEGAANVLDGRTRQLTVRRAAVETGAAAVVDALERRLG